MSSNFFYWKTKQNHHRFFILNWPCDWSLQLSSNCDRLIVNFKKFSAKTFSEFPVKFLPSSNLWKYPIHLHHWICRTAHEFRPNFVLNASTWIWEKRLAWRDVIVRPWFSISRLQYLLENFMLYRSGSWLNLFNRSVFQTLFDEHFRERSRLIFTLIQRNYSGSKLARQFLKHCRCFCVLNCRVSTWLHSRNWFSLCRKISALANDPGQVCSLSLLVQNSAFLRFEFPSSWTSEFFAFLFSGFFGGIGSDTSLTFRIFLAVTLAIFSNRMSKI